MASFADIHAKIELTETEDTWDKISSGLDDLRHLVHDDGSDQDPELLSLVRSVARPLISAMSSERTRLSGVAIETVAAVATGLGRQFDQLVPILFPPLLALCARANKVTVSRARNSISSIIENTQLPSLLPYFLDSSRDKSMTLRLACAEGTLSCLNSLNPPDLEKETRVHQIEAILRNTGRDASADVRGVAKKIYSAYRQLLPTRVDGFSHALSPTVKRTLGVTQTSSAAAASLAVPRPKSAAATSQKATSKLSSSASSAQGPPAARPQTSMAHTRSASSSSDVAPGLSRPVKALAHGKMAPPDFIPTRNVQPTRSAAPSRPASSASDQPKRPLSVHSAHSIPSRPASAQSTRSTDKDKSGTSSLSSSRNGPVRIPKSQPTSSSDHDRIVNLAKRVPLPEDDSRSRSGIDNGTSTSSMTGPRRAPAPHAASTAEKSLPNSRAAPRRPPVPILEGSKAAKAKAVETQSAPHAVSSKAPDTRPPRSTTISKPAPSSRSTTTKPSVQVSSSHKVPSASDAQSAIARKAKEPSAQKKPELPKPKPTAVVKKLAVPSKPAWGSRVPAAKTAASKAGSVPSKAGKTTVARPKQTLHTAKEAEIPLPPSPKLNPATDVHPQAETLDLRESASTEPHSQQEETETGLQQDNPSQSISDEIPSDEQPNEDAQVPVLVQEPSEVIRESHDSSDVSKDVPDFTLDSSEATRGSGLHILTPATPRLAQPMPLAPPEATPISKLVASIEQGFIMDTPAATPAPPRPHTPEDVTPRVFKPATGRQPLQDISFSDYLMSPVGSFPMELNSPGKIERVMQRRHEEAQNRPPIENEMHYVNPSDFRSDLSIAFERFNPGAEEWS